MSKNLRLPLFSLLSLLCLQAAAQNIVRGSLETAEGPLPFATVVLHAAADSSMVKAEITNDKGEYVLQGIKDGSYFLRASFVGLNPYESQIFDVDGPEVVLDVIRLSNNNELEAVKIVSTRPLVEVQADKTIFNVESSLNSTGTNGFEVLRKAPGVIIDNNDNIILEGKSGVQIFIDGKPAVLAGEDLTNYLKTLQSSDIEKIEIITQPSSKYDAAGSAGIINIKLKRDKGLGTNGSVSAGYSYGQNHRVNSSLSFNNRTRKTNLFGSYSNRFGKNWNYMYFDRTQSNVLYDSDTENTNDNRGHNARLGLDFFPHEFHTFGVLVDGSYFDWENDGSSVTQISPLDSGFVVQTLIASTLGEGDNFNANGNLNYRFADTTGHELGIDVDYGRYDRTRTAFQPNNYIQGTEGPTIFERNYRMVTPTDIEIYTAKIDYSQNFLGGKIGIGGKYSYVSTDNTFDFFDVVGTEDILNEMRSNNFVYTENVNAAYVNYSGKWGKWSAQAGVRMENTISEGDLTSAQSSQDDNVKRNYTDWFPSGGVTFNPDWKNQIALNYSRRIQRPDYASLNPFEFQLDELSFRRGNPFLQPQYTNNVKVSHTFKYRLTTSLSYSHVSDFFAQITDTIGTDQNFIQQRNVANQQTWSINVSYPFDATKWWSVYFNVSAFRSSYEGTDEGFVALDQNTLSFYAQNTFALPGDFKFEVSGWFSSPSIWGGTYRTSSLGSLDLAIQKKFMEDRLSLRVAASDILFTSPWFADMEFGDLYIDGTGGWESRQIRVNLSYNFGSNEIKGARNRKTGLEDESGRVGDGS